MILNREHEEKKCNKINKASVPSKIKYEDIKHLNNNFLQYIADITTHI